MVFQALHEKRYRRGTRMLSRGSCCSSRNPPRPRPPPRLPYPTVAQNQNRSTVLRWQATTLGASWTAGAGRLGVLSTRRLVAYPNHAQFNLSPCLPTHPPTATHAPRYPPQSALTAVENHPSSPVQPGRSRPRASVEGGYPSSLSSSTISSTFPSAARTFCLLTSGLRVT